MISTSHWSPLTAENVILAAPHAPSTFVFDAKFPLVATMTEAAVRNSSEACVGVHVSRSTRQALMLSDIQLMESEPAFPANPSHAFQNMKIAMCVYSKPWRAKPH